MPFWVPNTRRIISYAFYLASHLLSMEKIQCLKSAGAAISVGFDYQPKISEPSSMEGLGYYFHSHHLEHLAT
jgi:hypothetical protein